LSQRHPPWGYFFAGWALERFGRPADAIAKLKDAVRSSGDSPVMLAGLGHGYAAAGERHEALRIASELERLRHGKGLFAYEIGVIHAALNDKDRAFDWLARARDERSGWMAYLTVDSRLNALHADPRFADLTWKTPR
jgi:tetratricopeptide (TPR) repeat protein